MNQASASEAQTQQRSLNNSSGDTVSGPLVHLSDHLLNGSMSISLNSSPGPSFTSVIYGLWCITLTTSLVLNSPILLCTVYFYYGGTRTVHKLSRFGNASNIASNANDHALLNVG
ncbi:hypothetical protein TNCV_664741 [Trichonephila clavipes]|nr:hypothetical protein TNCV_664741 [Trichonephila clavipes]